MFKDYIALIKSEKGLVYSDGTKPYFPNRTFKDARVGIVRNPHVDKDKGTYAFISGEMIDTEPLTDDDILSFIRDNNMSCNAITRGVLTGSETQLCFIRCNDSVETEHLIFKSNGVVKVLVSVDMYSDKFVIRAFNSIYYSMVGIENNRREGGDNLTTLLLKVRFDNSDEVTREQAFEVGINLFSKFSSDNSIKVVNNRLIVSNSKIVYFKNGVKFEEPAVYFQLVDNKDVSYVISNEEIENFLIENHITPCYYSGDRNGKLVSAKKRVFNEELVVTMFPSDEFKLSDLNDELLVSQVTKSFEELDNFRKRVGKHCTSRELIMEMRKLTAKNILFNV